MAQIPSDIGSGGKVLLTGNDTELNMVDVFKDVAKDLEDLRAALGLPASLDLLEADVPDNLADGGRGLSPLGEHGEPSYKDLLEEAANDLDTINTDNTLGLTLKHTTSTLPSDLGDGGKGLSPLDSERSFKDVLFDIADDLSAIKTAGSPATDGVTLRTTKGS